jgi:hypothetical protein
MRVAFWLSVLAMAWAFACATPPTPTRYERGTFTPPPPAPVRPGVGLPRYDPHVAPLPPQPQPKPKRYLPPSREPGLWGAEEPRAALGPPRLEIEGIVIPLPHVDDAAEMERAIACAQAVPIAWGPLEAAAVLRERMDMKTCRIYLGWRHCMKAPFWPDADRAAAETIVTFSDAKMMPRTTPAQCAKWADAFKYDLEHSFDWNLKGWYYRTVKPRSP